MPETAEVGGNAIADSGDRSVDDGDVARHIVPGDGAMVAPASSAGQEEVVTQAGTKGLWVEVTIKLGVQSVGAGLTTAADSVAVEAANAD